MPERIINVDRDFLFGGGKMGELIRAKDWSKTPLFSPDTRPQSLRIALSICIAFIFLFASVGGSSKYKFITTAVGALLAIYTVFL